MKPSGRICLLWIEDWILKDALLCIVACLIFGFWFFRNPFCSTNGSPTLFTEIMHQIIGIPMLQDEVEAHFEILFPHIPDHCVYSTLWRMQSLSLLDIKLFQIHISSELYFKESWNLHLKVPVFMLLILPFTNFTLLYRKHTLAMRWMLDCHWLSKTDRWWLNAAGRQKMRIPVGFSWPRDTCPLHTSIWHLAVCRGYFCKLYCRWKKATIPDGSKASLYQCSGPRFDKILKI